MLAGGAHAIAGSTGSGTPAPAPRAPPANGAAACILGDVVVVTVGHPARGYSREIHRRRCDDRCPSRCGSVEHFRLARARVRTAQKLSQARAMTILGPPTSPHASTSISVCWAIQSTKPLSGKHDASSSRQHHHGVRWCWRRSSLRVCFDRIAAVFGAVAFPTNSRAFSTSATERV